MAGIKQVLDTTKLKCAVLINLDDMTQCSRVSIIVLVTPALDARTCSQCCRSVSLAADVG
jgi:hypothetical protein